MNKARLFLQAKKWSVIEEQLLFILIKKIMTARGPKQCCKEHEEEIPS